MIDIEKVAESLRICTGASDGCDGCHYLNENEDGDCQRMLNEDLNAILETIVENDDLLIAVQEELQ